MVQWAYSSCLHMIAEPWLSRKQSPNPEQPRSLAEEIPKRQSSQRASPIVFLTSPLAAALPSSSCRESNYPASPHSRTSSFEIRSTTAASPFRVNGPAFLLVSHTVRDSAAHLSRGVLVWPARLVSDG